MVHEPQKQEQEAKVSGKEDTDTSARMSSLFVRSCALMPTSPNDHRRCRHCQWNGLSPRSPHAQQEMVISLTTPRLGAPFSPCWESHTTCHRDSFDQRANDHKNLKLGAGISGEQV